MTTEDVRKAVEATRKNKDWLEKQTLTSGANALDTMIRVAEAWLALEEWVKPKTSTSTIMGYGSSVSSNFVDVYILLNKMAELLNPAPKSDIARVREEIEKSKCHIYSVHASMVNADNLLKLLDQLEQEKGHP